MSDKRYKKVEGSQGLFRDPYNNAIINMNVDEIKKARETQNPILAQKVIRSSLFK